ncbi:hypothetical protein CR205_16150 [Alteribacter lacisalsi]|uniref:NAD-dependent epimerase/dehydratase domain-containing protein n=1 Tax=Alteribacter lacisalsi TaxID=2045244 RepID=A0A2W0HGI2_9BACI|nr:NAD-dependent epimerase [Alteribacter lacisalsi]PYZ95909.1 hypothetical protein CR205_16150 [Alteribacter lacisalsi]
MNVFVTGAAGFIGMHTAERLLRNGCNVTGLDNMNSYYDLRLKQDRLARLQVYPGFRFYRADLSDRDALNEAFTSRNHDVVIHLGAQAGVRYSLENPEAYIESNISGFLNILEACRHHPVRHLLYASSSSVYGNNESIPFSSSDPVDHPVSLYAATKRSNELMAHTYSHLYGIPTSGLRFFTVYGPYGRPDMAYFSFAEKIMSGQPIRIFNEGRLERDFTYIDDIVEPLVRLISHPPEKGGRNNAPDRAAAPFRVYNIGNSQPVKLMRFIETLEECLGKKAVKTYVPFQKGDVMRTFSDTADLTAVTGYTPKTGIKEGLEHFTRWYLTYHSRKTPPVLT